MSDDGCAGDSSTGAGWELKVGSINQANEICSVTRVGSLV